MTTTAVEKEWITLAEVQLILGIGRTKAYELVATGDLPRSGSGAASALTAKSSTSGCGASATRTLRSGGRR